VEFRRPKPDIERLGAVIAKAGQEAVDDVPVGAQQNGQILVSGILVARVTERLLQGTCLPRSEPCDELLAIPGEFEFRVHRGTPSLLVTGTHSGRR
jgi:hypothetical protein